jgi:hypothetical protein
MDRQTDRQGRWAIFRYRSSACGRPTDPPPDLFTRVAVIAGCRVDAARVEGNEAPNAESGQDPRDAVERGCDSMNFLH